MDERFERLKLKGITLTPQRVAIIEYLMSKQSHPTADEIFDALSGKYSSMSKATVYSTLKLLVELGEIQKLSICKQGKARYDHSSHLHHHLLCRKCGKIVNIETECPDTACPIIKSSEVQGCKVEEMQAYLYGLCSECAKDSETTTTPSASPCETLCTTDIPK